MVHAIVLLNLTRIVGSNRLVLKEIVLVSIWSLVVSSLLRQLLLSQVLIIHLLELRQEFWRVAIHTYLRLHT